MPCKDQAPDAIDGDEDAGDGDAGFHASARAAGGRVSTWMKLLEEVPSEAGAGYAGGTRQSPEEKAAQDARLDPPAQCQRARARLDAAGAADPPVYPCDSRTAGADRSAWHACRGNLARAACRRVSTDDKEPFVGICPEIRLLRPASIRRERSGRASRRGATNSRSWRRSITSSGQIAIAERPTDPRCQPLALDRHEVDAHACGRTPVCDACNRLVGNGTVVVAAAGNAGYDESQGKATLGSGYRGTSITDPGNAELVITVGATHRIDPACLRGELLLQPRSDGRRTGKKPDLVAPGEKIRSDASGRHSMLIKDGTSMAAPHVSGVCALLMARHQRIHRTAEADQGNP